MTARDDFMDKWGDTPGIGTPSETLRDGMTDGDTDPYLYAVVRVGGSTGSIWWNAVALYDGQSTAAAIDKLLSVARETARFRGLGDTVELVDLFDEWDDHD